MYTTCLHDRTRELLLACLITAAWFACAAAAEPQWPRCAVRSGGAGAPAILVNGAPYAPLLFVGNNQFNRDEVLIQEIRQAAEAGIALFGFNLRLEWQTSASGAAAVLDKFCTAHPEGYFLLRIWLGPNAEWVQAHPDECITKSSGERLPLASPSSVLWRETTQRMLQERLREVMEGPHGNRFLGVTLEYLQTAEWFYPDTNDFMDYSPANVKAFRAWLKRTYRKDKALQAAWGQPGVRLETAEFPSPEARDAAAWGPFRDPVAQRAATDMQRFQSELVVDTIAWFAAAVKEVTQRRSLVGAYYGYTMELNINGPRALAQSGHLAFARLLECTDVDLIHAPFSYSERGLGQPGHLHAPVDSVALHGKLHICEEDAYTHLSQKPPKGMIAPGWDKATHSPAETLAVVRRDFATAFTHRCGMWFLDLLSDGRWRDNAVWQDVPDLRRIAAGLRSEPPFRPQVACVVDEESPHLLRATTYPILVQSLSWWRAELDRIGTPVGYYLQTDLPRLPDSVRVLLLANAYTLTPAERRAIDKRFDQGATVIWTYAPDVAGPDGLDLARIAETTGIAVEPKFDAVPMTIVSELTKDVIAIDERTWRPRFIVTSTDVDVVARYQQTGEVSAAAKLRGHGVSLYTATPRLSVPMLREICARAGVHLYRDTPGMTGVTGNYLIIHTGEAATHTLAWPAGCDHVERLAPARAAPMNVREGNRWTDTLPGSTTAIYRCE